MFSSGPKSRTTAAWLAIFLGWTGLHKFYLGRQYAGYVHVTLTGMGVMAVLILFALPENIAFLGHIVGWLVVVLCYFYVRRFQLGHTMAEIIAPARLLRYPFLLVRYPLRMVGWGSSIMQEESEEERREREWRRRRRRRGRYDGDDEDDGGGGFSWGCLVVALGVILTLAVLGAIILIFYLVFTIIGGIAGFVALVISVAVGVSEGIIYFTKSDDRFEREYVADGRMWF